MNNNNENNKQGGWVFLSHSHHDIDLVRKIRNKFEELGFEPLMFYLKCLSDKDEIEELIKREINERDWFVYLDSPNARNSTWVKTERDYIAKLKDKKVFTIDLLSNISTQLDLIWHISNQMKVFISYHPKDRELYKRIKTKLLEKDMLVLSDEQISICSDWTKDINKNINDACHSGFVIVLITEHTSNDTWILKEIKQTVANHGKLIPLYVGDSFISEEMIPLLGDIQGVHVSQNPTEDELDNLIVNMMSRVEYYHSDYRFSCGFLGATSIELPPISIIDDFTFCDCENLKEVYIPNSVISITKDAFKYQPEILIKCYAGSYAERYCIENKIKYELIK